MNAQENNSENALERLLKRHVDILGEEVDKCTKCKGKGEKQIFEDRSNIGSVICKYCNHGKINLLKIYREEPIDEIKQRLMINFSNPINDGSIKKDFIDCIDAYLSKITIVPKNLKEKLSSRYSINKFIELKWKNSKSKNTRVLLHIYLQYFLRTPTSPQLRRIKNITGLGKNWYRLTMDYYQCSRKITAADEKYENNKLQFKNYNDVDKSKRSELFKYSTMSNEDILRESFIEQLFWCIENNPQIYQYNEQEILFLNIESQKILMSKLNTSQSTHAEEFLDGWKNTLRHHIESLYGIDPKLFADNFSKLENDCSPSDFIKKILHEDGRKFNPLEDDKGLYYEYKASTFATQDNIERKILTISNQNKLNNLSAHSKQNVRIYATEGADNNVMNKILMTIVAFLNNDVKQGYILIGVEDDGTIRGIEKMHEIYNNRSATKADTIDKFLDAYRRDIQGKIADARQPDIEKNFKNNNISVSIETIPITKQKILFIKVKPNGNEICYFKDFHLKHPENAKSVVYVRKNGRNLILDGKALEEFTKKFINN